VKTNQPHPRLQPLSPDDRAHICALADEHSVGLEQRCARYRQRASARRYVLAACLFFGCCLSYSSAMTSPLYDQITTTGQSDTNHICNTINMYIENI